MGVAEETLVGGSEGNIAIRTRCQALAEVLEETCIAGLARCGVAGASGTGSMASKAQVGPTPSIIVFIVSIRAVLIAGGSQQIRYIASCRHADRAAGQTRADKTLVGAFGAVEGAVIRKEGGGARHVAVVIVPSEATLARVAECIVESAGSTVIVA